MSIPLDNPPGIQLRERGGIKLWPPGWKYLLRRTAVLAWCAPCVLGGCAFYSETRDAQGKAAKEAWSKVDLGAQTSTARHNLTQVYEKRLTLLEQAKQLRQEALVRSLAQSYDVPLQVATGKIQSALGINSRTYPCTLEPPPSGATSGSGSGYCSFSPIQHEWRRLRDRQQAQQDQYAIISAHALQFLGNPLPSCSTWLKSPEVRSTWIQQFNSSSELAPLVGQDAKAVTETCQSIDTAQQARIELVKQKSPSSLWIQETSKAQAAQSELDRARAAALSISREVQASRQALETAEQEGHLQKLQEATRRFEDAIAKLHHAAAILPDNAFLKNSLLQAKQESLNAFLKTIKDAKPGEDPPAASGKAAAAAVLFANFFDSTSKRLKASEQHGLAVFVLERRLAEIEQGRVQRELQVLQQKVALAKAREMIAEEQLHSYMNADAHWSKLPASVRRMPVHPALLGNSKDAPGPAIREDLWMPLGYYLDTGPRLDAAMQRLAVQQTSLDRMEVVSAAETSLQSWSALIDTNVDQLATWAGTGIRNEQISQLINNIAAVFIAYGVNK